MRGLATTAQAVAFAEGVAGLHRTGGLPGTLASIIEPTLAASDEAAATSFWVRLTEILTVEELEAVQAVTGGGARERINPVTLRFDRELLMRLRVYQAAHASTLSEAARDIVRVGLDALGY